MGYSDIERIEAGEIDLDGSTGDKFVFGFKRAATVLGWGCYVTEALGSPAQDAVIELDHDPASGARVNKDSFSLLDASALGTAVERSELMRGRGPTAPNAVFASFDVVEGDLIMVELATAQTATVAGKAKFYVLVAPKGSL